MSSRVSFTMNDGIATETITLDRTAQYVHITNGAGDRVSIPRELLTAILATLARE